MNNLNIEKPKDRFSVVFAGYSFYLLREFLSIKNATIFTYIKSQRFFGKSLKTTEVHPYIIIHLRMRMHLRCSLFEFKLNSADKSYALSNYESVKVTKT